MLARILGPHEFGAFAVAMVALLALLSFNELGVSLAIVRWEGEPSEIAPTVTTISVVTSVIIYAGCFLGAQAFASAMGAPSAADVIRVLSINVIFDGLVATPGALMQRYFRQRRKMIADQANNWVGTGTSVGLALLHFGAMSLAIGRLTGAAVAAVLFIAFSPEPLRFGFDPVKARELLRFGMPLAGASIVVFAVQNADQIVVGHVPRRDRTRVLRAGAQPVELAADRVLDADQDRRSRVVLAFAARPAGDARHFSWLP